MSDSSLFILSNIMQHHATSYFCIYSCYTHLIYRLSVRGRLISIDIIHDQLISAVQWGRDRVGEVWDGSLRRGSSGKLYKTLGETWLRWKMVFRDLERCWGRKGWLFHEYHESFCSLEAVSSLHRLPWRPSARLLHNTTSKRLLRWYEVIWWKSR